MCKGGVPSRLWQVCGLLAFCPWEGGGWVQQKNKVLASRQFFLGGAPQRPFLNENISYTGYVLITFPYSVLRSSKIMLCSPKLAGKV